MLYVTTSRKPSPSTRRLARWLAALLHAKTENRGKRSIAEISGRAEAAGAGRVLVVGESHGNPAELSFLDPGSGEWLGAVGIACLGIPEERPRMFPKGLEAKAVGPVEKKAAKLLVPEEWGEGERVAVVAREGRLWFEARGRGVGPVLKLRSVG